jgi:hypothetical protein
MGFLKIGIQTGFGSSRIYDQNRTPNVETRTLYTTEAVDKNGKSFTDKDIHRLLKLRGHEHTKLHNKTSMRDSEWVKVSLEDAIDAITDYQNGTLDYAGIKTIKSTEPLYELRTEQQEAVDLTYNYWQNLNENEGDKPEFLWNAKPRFGKTLTAYDFMKRIEAKKVMVVTNRPAVSDSWYTDYHKFINKNTDYVFGAAKPIRNSRQLNNREVKRALKDGNKLIYFISLQDIKGTVDEGFKEKNRWIFDEHWDLLVIDEMHEGTATKKANKVFDTLNCDFTLHLSGTPFKALAGDNFTERNIFNWTYPDEQIAKSEWSILDGENPYADMPQMNIYAYQLSKALQIQASLAKSADSEYAFDLGEFFSITGSRFKHEEKVKLFLDNLAGVHTEQFNATNSEESASETHILPFSTTELREQLKHTFWLLPGVKECNAMKKLLNNHPIFGEDYEIVLAAGKGDDEHAGDSALEKVRTAIKNTHNDWANSKTITLSCGQLTTGITIPEWTAVLMLNNTSSPELYMQTAFRCQNSWHYEQDGESVIKTDCFVFDFAPDRVLKIIKKYAKSTVRDGKNIDEKIRVLLNFLPVIAESENGVLTRLDANEVIMIPLKLVAQEVVQRGFMSNRLFKNIANIFGAPAEIREIVERLATEKGRKLVRGKKLSESQIVLDENGEPVTSDEEIRKVINSTGGLLGKKKYAIIGTPEGDKVQEAIDRGEITDMELVTREKHDEIIKEAALKKIKDEKTKEKLKSENEVRDHLRGFTRTIPMILMAYGKPDTNLANFEKYVSDDTFLDLTSITKNEFRRLRDDYKFFNESVFNSAIKEFLNRKRILANYFETDQTEDIFDYIPPQVTNQIYTPKNIIKQMADNLENYSPHIFRNKRTTFFDPYMKSGLFIVEIVKRLYRNLETEIPDHKERIKHILTKQVFGFAPTDILLKICRESIYGFTKQDDWLPKESREFERNFLLCDLVPELKGKQKRDLQDIINEQFATHERKGVNMKFDVIIGNPPYQENDGGAQASATPLYNHFIDAARELNPHYLSMIIPSRWMVGGKGLDKFRERMLKDRHMQSLHDFPSEGDVFNDVSIKGGVCYFLRNARYDGKCEISVHSNGEIATSKRYLDEGDAGVFIRDSMLIQILQQVWEHKDLQDVTDSMDDEHRISSMIDTRKPYGFPSDFIKDPAKYNYPPVYRTHEEAQKVAKTVKAQSEPAIKIYGLLRNKRVERYIPHDYPLRVGGDTVNNWKVFIPESYGCGAIGETIPTPILGSPILGSPIQICTETYLRFGKFDTEYEATAALNYLKTKFFRCLVGVKKITQHTTRKVYTEVPIQDFTPNSDIDWSKSIREIDEQLYVKYGLSKEEVEFVENNVKEMV